ncbi:hypothetical protein [Clostridium thermarum]|uniref:hypothetical protein n=1 Tax=Clostridium thermarum TaxID=1716543 RepID=UPI00111E8811|nr:hypothetical protein [Clostridium thermarum]
MLSYALLMALLSGNDNKDIKTILIIGIILAILLNKNKAPRRIRRARGRRARRILAAREAEIDRRRESTFEKIQDYLPIVTQVLELLITNCLNKNNQQQNTNYEEDNYESDQGYDDSINRDQQEDSSQSAEEGKKVVNSEKGSYVAEDDSVNLADYDITKIIKDIFHGDNVTLALTNGQTVSGEVVGEYKGVLILRNSGKLNYIRGEAISGFS